jgi:SAM-dependent methyltransferase
VFYGADQAAIHHERFGALAAGAAVDLLDALAGAGLHGGTVVDLGCGSGILARVVADAGYDVVGVDLSPAMVALARAEAPGASFAVGSIHDADLPPECVGVTAIGEVLNYGTDERSGLAAIRRLARRVHDALVPAGVWLLDVSGPGRAGPTGTAKQFHRYDEWCLGMTASESPGGRRLDRAVTIFVAEADGRYRRIDEHHVLHLYARDELAAAVAGAGFALEVGDGYRTPTAHPAAMPGWYVVRATKPVA